MSILLQEIKEDILFLTINRPAALNALNRDVFQALDEVFSADLTSYVGIILTGSGEKAFAAGADIKEFLALDEQSGKELSLQGKAVMKKIERSDVPVIAVINGYALGGGCELALACHLIIAESHAKFGFPEVNLGLLPGYSGTQRMIQRVGRSRALEFMMTAGMISADQAESWGLASYKVDAGQGVVKATELLKKIGSKGPNAVAMVIQSVQNYFDYGAKGDEMESELFGRAMVSEEAKEGIQAFLDKRKAAFKRGKL
ncbi:UNVERIFIED_CONTAM: hypothetical protein GTU68_025703 [Idotea baltica]|nr:hypothetical protein [Idotea baltica]